MILIIAEKPSVARDIARVVGANRSGQGYIEGGTYTVTWAIGHLVTLPQPSDIHPDWKAWRKEALPMLPETWPLQVLSQTKTQFKVIKSLMKTCTSLICATDAGREGELIFRYIYEAAKCKKPFKRLWISSLTPDAIQDGLKKLQDGSLYNGLADAARARSCADWLIGMNLSRTYALTFGEKFFVGRVQTPTLAMIVKRDFEIKNFKSENYSEILAVFSVSIRDSQLKNASNESSEISGSYESYYLGEEGELPSQNSAQAKRLSADQKSVQKIIDRVKIGCAQVQSVDPKRVKQPPPLLYDLTELQRHANRLYGFSATRTLEVAQALYERHKLISYPRTGSKYLSSSVANTLPKIIQSIRRPYEKNILASTGSNPLGSRFVNDAEVSDHHAMIPTGVSSERVHLSEEERKIYDLICRRILSAYQGDYVTSVTTVFTQVQSVDSLMDSIGQKDLKFRDLFRSQGTVVEQLGWKKLDVVIYESDSAEKIIPKGLKSGETVGIKEVKSELRKTKAPPHLTEASLLTAMESAGKTLDDRELAALMKDTGLGTPATRAGIIETLLSRGYLERKGKSLISTSLGSRLIEVVHPSVKSPELTARWEKGLFQIQSGKQTFKNFMFELETELKVRVKEVLEVRPSGASHPQSVRVSTPHQWSQKWTQASPESLSKISPALLHIVSQGPLPAGRLFEAVAKSVKKIERREFEQVLKSLSDSGSVQIVEAKFDKSGKTISYRRVSM